MTIKNKKIAKRACAVMLSLAMAMGTMVPATTAEAAGGDTPAVKTPVELSYAGYTMKWEDEFNGTSLSRNDWNVELHEPGWVNAELQEYVDSENNDSNKNIVVKDGKLYLIPIKEGEGKDAHYTSGRVNTQNKHDFKYGLFEAKVKVPKGMGYLPAFWMMPTNENLYGQWPKCGEIDAMEVMGQNTNKLYGTIHYGAPHGQKQGTVVINNSGYVKVDSDSGNDINGNYTFTNVDSFADNFHTFSVEWEPDHISWYVDGVKYHEANDWFSAVEGGGEVAYPAPFDQPFYMILNLAVGGSWVGYPDETTTYGEDSAFVIDSVRVYQKEASYYEEKEANAVKPEKIVTYKEADANGNYVTNGNFAAEIDSENDWTLHLESDAEGTTCAVADNSIKITSASAGAQTHSIQLKQAGLPLYRGVEYTLSFNAKADAARTMVVDIEGPDKNWTRYFKDTTVDLTTENHLFTYDFTMDAATDANCSLEFNLGKQDSTTPVTISNVSLKVKDESGKVDESKLHEVRADGNYVYNGSFQEGAGRLGYWEISDDDKTKISVTNANNERRLKIVAPEGTTAENPVVVKQSNLPLVTGKYSLSYKAYKENASEDDRSLVITVGKVMVNDVITEEEKAYDSKFGYSENDATTFTMSFTAPGTYYVDDIMICEDAMIKNGSFDAGLAGFTQYTYDTAVSEYTIDSQQEDNAFDITIKDTGTEDWHVQLYQDGISLEKDKCYRLKFDAKSPLLDRNITCVIQRNGSADDDWTPYFSAIKADLTSEWKTFTKDFKMKSDSDPVARFGFAMGKIDERITTQHRIFIDNISLEEIDEAEADIPENQAVPANPVGVNLLKNASFEKQEDVVPDWETTVANWNPDEGQTAAADIAFNDGKAAFEIEDVGSDVWHVQIKQSPVVLKKGEKYQVSFKISSTTDRNIMWGIQHNGGLDGSNDYTGYCGGEEIGITSGEKVVTDTFTMPDDDTMTSFYISMGKMESGKNAPGTITISEPKLEKVLDEEPVEDTTDKDAADAVAKLINAIGKVNATEACKAKIDTADKAYDALTDGQKALVDKGVVKKLTDAKQAYKDAKAVADKAAEDAKKDDQKKDDQKKDDRKKEDEKKTAEPVVTVAKDGNSNNNGVVEAGETAVAEQGTYTAVSATEAVYTPSELAKNSESVVIPAIVKIDGQDVAVTQIPKDAFKGAALKNVTIGANIKMIGDGAFQNATNLTTVKLGKSVAKLDKNSFAGCTKLKKVISSGSAVTSIGESAFKGDKALTSVDFSKSRVKTIGKNAFNGDKKLNTIKLNGNAITKVGKGAFKNIKKKATITIYAKDKKTYNKVVKLIKKSGASSVKYKYKKKK